jgi:hypothetical protein
LIGIFVLIDDGIFQVVHKIDRSVEINTFHSGNDFVLDLVLIESAALANDTDFDFGHAGLGLPFQANMNQKLHADSFLILDCPSIFTWTPGALSKSKPHILISIESKLIEVFESIHPNVYGPFPNNSYGGSE